MKKLNFTQLVFTCCGFFEHILRYFANMYVLIFYTLYVYRVFYMDLYPFHMAHPVFFAADLLLLHILWHTRNELACSTKKKRWQTDVYQLRILLEICDACDHGVHGIFCWGWILLLLCSSKLLYSALEIHKNIKNFGMNFVVRGFP